MLHSMHQARAEIQRREQYMGGWSPGAARRTQRARLRVRARARARVCGAAPADVGRMYSVCHCPDTVKQGTTGRCSAAQLIHCCPDEVLLGAGRSVAVLDLRAGAAAAVAAACAARIAVLACCHSHREEWGLGGHRITGRRAGRRGGCSQRMCSRCMYLPGWCCVAGQPGWSAEGGERGLDKKKRGWGESNTNA
jgi:hypothetical protein